MQGIEISKKYFEEHGLPLLRESFSELLPYIAVGFVGQGSEHFGFDDEISRDHDFEPGFTIFLPDESVVDRRSEFLLEKAYLKLPKEFMGLRRQTLTPVGGARNGVIRIADFYERSVGSRDGVLSDYAWLKIPDYALAESTNGEIFFDNYGLFTKIRENLMNMPRRIKQKRLAGNLLLMGQSGQYNFPRCIKHGEPEASQLALNEFVTSALKVVFLLNDRYMPYYKWSFRALAEIGGAERYREKLSFLLVGDNRDSATATAKVEAVEAIAAHLAVDLVKKGYAEDTETELEPLAYGVNNKIENADIRNLHILYAI